MLILLLILSVFPSTSRTAWMEPDAFHLRLGMSRAQAVAALEKSGWKPKDTKQAGETVVEYDDGKTVTLRFERGRLSSIRFELVDFVPGTKKAFEEHREFLKASLGEPRELHQGKTLIYERDGMNIFAVVSTDPRSEFGKRGLGFFVVRYFLPPTE